MLSALAELTSTIDVETGPDGHQLHPVTALRKPYRKLTKAVAALPATPGRAPHTPAATHTLRPRPASPGRGRAPRP